MLDRVNEVQFEGVILFFFFRVLLEFEFSVSFLAEISAEFSIGAGVFGLIPSFFDGLIH